MTRDAAATSGADNLAGAAWMAVSAASATAMLTSVRMLVEIDDARPETLAFLRTSLGLWVAVVFLIDGRLFRFSFKNWRLHVVRGVLIGIALTLAFVGVARLPLATVTILLFLAPVFATALAGPALGERVGWRRWLAVGAGFLGAVIVVRPGVAAVALGAAAALAAAFAFSLSLLLTKSVSRDAGAGEILLSTTFCAALATAPLALVDFDPPTGRAAWGWVAVLVLSSSLRMYADIRAYAVGDAGFIAPFAYLRLVFAAAVGWIVFSEALDLWTWIGGAIIVGATLVIALRDRAEGRGAGDA